MLSIPNITIEQGFGALGIEVTPAQMKITTPTPEMQITSEPAEFEVEHQRPEFKINWNSEPVKKLDKPVRVKAPPVLTGASVQTAKIDLTGDGDMLGKARAQGVKNARAASHNTIEMDQVKISLNSSPKTSPEVEWTPGTISVNWTRGTLSVDWVGEYMPQVVIDPPFSIDVFLREKPYIKIMVEDGTIPDYIGSNIDLRL